MATESLWIVRDGQARLQGSHCRDCGARAFPAAEGCIVCGSTALNVVDLASEGKIESRTLIGARTVCEVRLDDGLLVMGWLEASSSLEIGASVRFAPRDQGLRFVPYV